MDQVLYENMNCKIFLLIFSKNRRKQKNLNLLFEFVQHVSNYGLFIHSNSYHIWVRNDQ